MGDKSLRFSIGLSVGDGRVRDALARPAFKERLAGEGVDVRVAGDEKHGKNEAISENHTCSERQRTDYQVLFHDGQDTYIEGRSVSFPRGVSDG